MTFCIVLFWGHNSWCTVITPGPATWVIPDGSMRNRGVQDQTVLDCMQSKHPTYYAIALSPLNDYFIKK